MIYLIHCDSPYHRAHHYVATARTGSSRSVARHRAGRDSPLMLAAELAGIEWLWL